MKPRSSESALRFCSSMTGSKMSAAVRGRLQRFFEGDSRRSIGEDDPWFAKSVPDGFSPCLQSLTAAKTVTIGKYFTQGGKSYIDPPNHISPAGCHVAREFALSVPPVFRHEQYPEIYRGHGPWQRDRPAQAWFISFAFRV